MIAILLNSSEISESIRLSFSICINNLFPSLIPFMILSNILIKYNFIEALNEIFGNIIKKTFGINKNCSFAVILSMFTGTPSNGKYLKDLYENKLIDNIDIQKSLNFCHFANPIFILSTIGHDFLNNKRIGLIILISHYLGSFIIGFFKKSKINKEIYINKNINNENRKNFINIFNNSINDTVNNLILILGVITVCLVISTILNNIFNINNNFKFIYGLLEITQGLKYLSLSNFNILVKSIISTFLISFGGISIHIQVFSIIENKKIRYLPYLFSRIIHGILSCFICFILMYIYKI